MLVRKTSVEEMNNNVYVVACIKSREALVLDLAARPARLLDVTADLTVRCAAQTHGHWDHVRAWATLADDHGWPVYGHRGDASLFPRACDRWLAHGDVIQVGEVSIEVIHVSGHTPGSLLFLVEVDSIPHLFSGDSLFPGGFGATFGDAEAFAALSSGVIERVFARLPDETVVHPGHGDATTLGHERPHLDEWVARGW